MKRTPFFTISASTLSLIATPSFAKKVDTTSYNQITPFNLVIRSYQGHL